MKEASIAALERELSEERLRYEQLREWAHACIGTAERQRDEARAALAMATAAP